MVALPAAGTVSLDDMFDPQVRALFSGIEH